MSCRTRWQKKSCSRSPALMQSAPCRLSYRYKVSSTLIKHSFFVLFSYLDLSLIPYVILLKSEQHPHQCGVCALTPVTCIHMAVAGQYWQSLKAYSGSVGLSYLAAQRRDCEETDAVNALASLSVGVLSNKRYSTHIHTHKDKNHTSPSFPLTSVFRPFLQPHRRANGA